MSADTMPLSIAYNNERDVLTVDGVEYSGHLFRTLALCEPGTWLRFESRCDGVVTVSTPGPEREQVFDELRRLDLALIVPVQRALRERVRQVTDLGFTAAHDDEHEDGSLAAAAACYATHAAIQSGVTAGKIDRYAEPHRRFDKIVPDYWPWDREWWKPAAMPDRNLEKAIALLFAELERLHRTAERAHRST
jgi:hypothetical protein